MFALSLSSFSMSSMSCCDNFFPPFFASVRRWSEKFLSLPGFYEIKIFAEKLINNEFFSTEKEGIKTKAFHCQIIAVLTRQFSLPADELIKDLWQKHYMQNPDQQGRFWVWVFNPSKWGLWSFLLYVTGKRLLIYDWGEGNWGGFVGF